jgi:nitrous oxide reductase
MWKGEKEKVDFLSNATDSAGRLFCLSVPYADGAYDGKFLYVKDGDSSQLRCDS